MSWRDTIKIHPVHDGARKRAEAAGLFPRHRSGNV
jgi:hypothetical protein